MWYSILSPFSFKFSESPSHDAQHHQKRLIIALIHWLREQQLFFLANFTSFFLMFFLTCHTSNWCKMCFRNFLIWDRICLFPSVAILPILIPHSCKRSTTLLKPSNSILCESPATRTWEMWSLEYDQIDCPSTCKSRILHCRLGIHTNHHQANGFWTLLLHFQTTMLY